MPIPSPALQKMMLTACSPHYSLRRGFFGLTVTLFLFFRCPLPRAPQGLFLRPEHPRPGFCFSELSGGEDVPC